MNTFFSKSNLKFDISSLSYIPRWIVLIIDIFILIISFLFTKILLEASTLHYVPNLYKSKFVPFFIITNILLFWIFRTYSGIIRHSSYIDALKLFLSQFFMGVFFISINLIYYQIYHEKPYLNTGVFINCVISFCGLFIYRVLVKQTFDSYFVNKTKEQLIRTVIYGIDANAISVANALKFEVPARFKVVGFIDKNKQNSNKRMLNLPILIHRKKISALMRSIDATGLILADKSLSQVEQLEIVENCLEFNYKVFTVPIISDWKNKKEISQKVKSIQIEDLLNRKPIVLDNNLITKQLREKNILITGAAGSIGSEIVRQVLEFNPKKLIILDQAETPLHHLALELEKKELHTKVETIVADVRNKIIMEKVFKTYLPDVLFHAAAYKHVPLMEENPVQAIITNVLGTKIIADLSCKYRVKKFVMISTDKAVNPSNVMGASKRIAEKYVRCLQLKNDKENDFKTKFITTRFGNVLGSNGSVVPLFTEQIAAGGPVTITHKDIIRYFMTIPEACQLVLEAGCMGEGGEIYIFDMGKPVKIIDLAKKMIQLAGFTPEKDIQIKTIGLRPGEKLFEELLSGDSKTKPTHHEKIMISEEIQEEYNKTIFQVEELIDFADNFASNEQLVIKMKQIVPEYKSMNSVYKKFDE